MLYTGWRNFETTTKFLLHGIQPRKVDRAFYNVPALKLGSLSRELDKAHLLLDE
jgi:hypothetical protein